MTRATFDLDNPERIAAQAMRLREEAITALRKARDAAEAGWESWARYAWESGHRDQDTLQARADLLATSRALAILKGLDGGRP